MRRWRISYLPRTESPGVVEWVFHGSEFELDEYLQKNHSCECPDCKDVYWWDSAQACEYQVEEIVEEEKYEY